MLNALYYHTFVRPSLWWAVVMMGATLAYIWQTPYEFTKQHYDKPTTLIIAPVKIGGQIYAIFQIPKDGYVKNSFKMPCDALFGSAHHCTILNGQSYQANAITFWVNQKACQNSFFWVKHKTRQCPTYISNVHLTDIDGNQRHYKMNEQTLQQHFGNDTMHRYWLVLFNGVITMLILYAIRDLLVFIKPS